MNYLLPFVIIAGSVSLSWTPPTQNVDGSAYTDPAGYYIFRSDVAGGPYANSVHIDDPTVTTYVWDNLPAGTHYFVATAVNQSGLMSDYSNEAMKVVVDTPAPPTGLTVVEPNLTVYGVSQTKDRFVTYPVGSVPAGTACDGSMSANGLYLVPVDSVQFVGSVRPVVVFAECSGG